MKNKAIRLLSLFLAAIFACGMLSACENGGDTVTTAAEESVNPASEEFFVFKEEEFEGTKYYSLDGITDKGKEQKELEIPESYNGLTVLALNTGCFTGCDKLEKLTIHSNVHEFYSNLFPGCKNLRTIVLDFAQYAADIKADTSLADGIVCATAGDGSVCGTNSFLEGLDEKKISLVFLDDDTCDYFSSEYTWGVFASIMTVQN